MQKIKKNPIIFYKVMTVESLKKPAQESLSNDLKEKDMHEISKNLKPLFFNLELKPQSKRKQIIFHQVTTVGSLDKAFGSLDF